MRAAPDVTERRRARVVPNLSARTWAAIALGAAQVLVAVFLSLTVVLGGWLTGQSIAADYSLDAAHPGYFLPTVTGGLVGAFSAGLVQLHAVAEVSFGMGIVAWLLLGSFTLGRLFFRPSLPAALVPTLAIEVAPPAVAGVAYFFVSPAAYTTAVAALINLFIAAVTIRTAIALSRRQLLPASPAAPGSHPPS
jgi:tellurite resistance protein